MAVKEDYTLEDVIEVINLNNATLGIELAGIRTNINIILNPELTSTTLVENKDLLKTLLKILDKAFNSYLMNENLYMLNMNEDRADKSFIQGYTYFFRCCLSEIQT